VPPAELSVEIDPEGGDMARPIVHCDKPRFNRSHLVLVLLLSAGCSGLSAQHITDVWGGARSCIALCSDSTVWCWGFNWFGKLGDGTTIDRPAPVQVHGPNDVGYLNSVTAIMGGEAHNVALRADSTVWCWGGNVVATLHMGLLGNGDSSLAESHVPVQVAGPGGIGFLHSVEALGGRGYHSLALKSDGAVWAWGYNAFGQLGNNDPSHASRCYPVQVQGLDRQAVAVTGGYDFSIALMSDSTLRSWGRNNTGQLGNNGSTASDVPVTVYRLDSVVQVSCGWTHALALKADGTVWTWGSNTCGQLGDGTHTFSNVPLQVAGLSSIIDVSGGDGSSLALQSDGTIWKWGAADTGHTQSGPNPTDRVAPVQVAAPAGMTNIVLARARDYHNVALTADGKVWAWGFNENGQCGDGTANNVKSIPVLVQFPWSSVGVQSFAGRTNGFSMVCSPNPSRAVVTFRLPAIGKEEPPELSIYSLSGGLVADLTADSRQSAATYCWNAAGAPSGEYIARLTVGGRALTRKVMLWK
jgi:alpha-tubulin suppressor-like RCC1 family protein